MFLAFKATDIITVPFGWLLNQLYSLLGNYGVAMILFAFTTLLGNLFYVDKAINDLLGKEPTKLVRNICYVVASLVIFVGAGLSADMLWNIADVLMGGMTIINIPVILYLGKYAYRALRDYEHKSAEGLKMTFCKKDIGLSTETDYWN